MKDRIELLEYINDKHPNGVMVEIGIASGCFTKQILATYKTLKVLHCIDNWEHQESGYNDGCNLSNEEQLGRYRQFLKDMDGEPRVKTIKEWSHIAVHYFPNKCIDAIYLDANHSYEACKQDLELWYPKLKVGGIFSGHDYCEGDKEGHGVKAAVDEFCASKGLTVVSTTNEYCREEGVYGAAWEGYSFMFEKLE